MVIYPSLWFTDYVENWFIENTTQKESVGSENVWLVSLALEQLPSACSEAQSHKG